MKYTVIGYYVENTQRYAEHVEAGSPEEACRQCANKLGEDSSLMIVAVVAGHHNDLTNESQIVSARDYVPRHTPGPWAVQDGYRIGSPMGNIARLFRTDNYMQGDMTANARLIAAAPDLLEACEMVFEAAADNGDMDGIDWGMLRAACSKATGSNVEEVE